MAIQTSTDKTASYGLLCFARKDDSGVFRSSLNSVLSVLSVAKKLISKDFPCVSAPINSTARSPSPPWPG